MTIQFPSHVVTMTRQV